MTSPWVSVRRRRASASATSFDGNCVPGGRRLAAGSISIGTDSLFGAARVDFARAQQIEDGVSLVVQMLDEHATQCAAVARGQCFEHLLVFLHRTLPLRLVLVR